MPERGFKAGEGSWFVLVPDAYVFHEQTIDRDSANGMPVSRPQD